MQRVDREILLQGDELDVVAEEIVERLLLRFNELLIASPVRLEEAAFGKGDVKIAERYELFVIVHAGEREHELDDVLLKALPFQHLAEGGHDVIGKVERRRDGVERGERVGDVGDLRPLLLDVAGLALHAEDDGAQKRPRGGHLRRTDIAEKGLGQPRDRAAALFGELLHDVLEVEREGSPLLHRLQRLARFDVQRKKFALFVERGKVLARARPRHVDGGDLLQKVEAHRALAAADRNGDIERVARVDVLFSVAGADSGDLFLRKARLRRALDDEIGDVLIAVGLRERALDDLARRTHARDEPHADHHDEDDG